MRALRDAAEEHPGVDWIAISHAGPEATQRWCDAIGGRGDVEGLLDVDRSFYAAWGLRRSSLGHFLCRRSLREVARLAREGIRNRHPDGTRWQQAGAFAVDASDVVRWRHLPEHAGELPDLGEAVAAVRPKAGAASAGPRAATGYPPPSPSRAPPRAARCGGSCRSASSAGRRRTRSRAGRRMPTGGRVRTA